MIFGLVGNQLNTALKTGHRAGEFAKLVIALPKQEMKRSVVRGFCGRVSQSVNGLVIMSGVKFALRIGNGVLCAASGARMQRTGCSQQNCASQTEFHSENTGRIRKFSLSETSPGNATRSPSCKPERTSIIVGFAMPTLISRRCRRLSCTTNTYRLPPSINKAPRGSTSTLGRSLVLIHPSTVVFGIRTIRSLDTEHSKSPTLLVPAPTTLLRPAS